MRSSSKAPLITIEEDLQAIVPALREAEVVALDLETTGLDLRKNRTRLLSLATESGTWIVDCFCLDVRELFEPLTEKTLIVHNAMHGRSHARALATSSESPRRKRAVEP